MVTPCRQEKGQEINEDNCNTPVYCMAQGKNTVSMQIKLESQIAAAAFGV